MPRRNRVTPFGDIVATPARGEWMGNRGRLHDSAGKLLDRRWERQAWLICRLEFRGRRRTLMSPDSYTELFFLDEATALAAGHRPCFECRRADFHRFLAAWLRGNAHLGLPAGSKIAAVDRQLHAERATRDRRKVTFQSRSADLPHGVLVELADLPGEAWLINAGRLRRWSPSGYQDVRSTNGSVLVGVLTPASTVQAIRAGYQPAVHRSA